MAGLFAINTRNVDVPALAEEALWQELDLTPKPGLVDKYNNGAHRDMDHALFVRSIAAITPWFTRFAELGDKHAHRPAGEQLRMIRPMGIACEQAMYAATGGVNTHKGGIFALGLLCFAAGRLGEVNPQRLCREVSDICRGLVERELASRSSLATAGERQFHQFGLTGARGEAESGFATVRKALSGWNRRHLHALLLRLMAVNPDSNLVSRGGMNGLRYVQDYAHDLLENGWDEGALIAMDNALITRNLSPGGSADLLSVGWVLSKVSA
ncbi:MULTISPECIES: triphosphoribosyl-dephospho-CoA synthase CitG [Enterobacteriaceae]|uniref:Probable 2-(5''-triphosphoribosyl)-3'-dephosphocoenzyme-A synthase n=1 Tax=Kluyvera genomosp. 2 TaxID=2774054 RepID=A0A2T2Y3G0_9ENTR|nr:MULTISPECIES: triphosphoribosyl-dephospho-CoA synthase CitG [Enterobacteriaceae]HAT3918002.1 triphosphoribosyl-dephospho-CoA synthase CitG [Kluyvera ascorbata]PSR47069.1 triphosphoribosyl-dephospho-CoA synthase CitG [Kluyvera genomosp. 2]BBQ82258.1 putative 2-(5''-triphosphoribosyl)-3'-dephosphocoenzyme-A synthase [Klebsiella sp. WP3-W18-ESBL-02]BBR19339.1 putative 2-(5''-triphosphoribosyl)-3'-dephosphocoenzyme-A synthase [Klebsiella sp. WP3-S18-ESBL-05]BBR57477.1 putative 2-(5''-triphospho